MPNVKCTSTFLLAAEPEPAEELQDWVVRNLHCVKGWGLDKMHSNSRYK